MITPFIHYPASKIISLNLSLRTAAAAAILLPIHVLPFQIAWRYFHPDFPNLFFAFIKKLRKPYIKIIKPYPAQNIPNDSFVNSSILEKPVSRKKPNAEVIAQSTWQMLLFPAFRNPIRENRQYIRYAPESHSNSSFLFFLPNQSHSTANLSAWVFT